MKSYALHTRSDGKYISGHEYDSDALASAVFLMLNVERGRYEIFPDDFGIEYDSIIGKRREYAESFIKRQAEECIGKYFPDAVSSLSLGYSDGVLSVFTKVKS